MNFDYTEEQQLLADSVRRFLQKDYGFEARKRILASPEGASEAAWRCFAEMGLTALPLSPDYGGFGGGAVDLMGAMEAFGEALVVEPYLPTVLAAFLVARAGDATHKAAILPHVASGELKLAVAYAEPGARHELHKVATRASRVGGAWRVDGDKRMVLGAPLAGKLVVSAVAGDTLSLFLVDASNARAKRYRTLDNMAVADLVFDAAPAERIGGDLALLEEGADFATALVCAEAVGAMKFACEATLEYLKTRKQFGVPIGTFQALQHRMVDMYIAQEQARSMACLACSKVDRAADAADRSRAVSAAKIRIADAARHVSQESIQLHGGMGMTEEMKVSHAFRRLTVIAQQFGDADHHLARFSGLAPRRPE